jgi:hypothetical protein
MASFLTRRAIVAGASVAAMAAVPAVAFFAGVAGPAPAAVADCSGGINMNVMSEGVPVSGDCPLPASSAPTGGIGNATGGAPSEGLLSACSGEPGCLSYAYYGPGNVQVPNRSTQVHQSQ